MALERWQPPEARGQCCLTRTGRIAKIDLFWISNPVQANAPSMDMFNFSSQAVGDGHRLNSILSSLPRTAFVDLRFNRITVAGLQQVVTWLKSRPTVSVCVTGNLFAFDAFYSTLKDMDAIDFVVQRRLNMSYTDQE